MEHFGICPASCGELIQGQLEHKEFLSSYCVGLYSKATIKECTSHKPLHHIYPKATKAMTEVFRKFGQEKNLDKISLEIMSNIPRSKGMASSSADIGAVIGACSSYLGVDIDSQTASELAAEIEPTDSIFFEDLVVMDPLKGKLIKSLKMPENLKTIILEPPAKVNTLDTRRDPHYRNFKKNNIPHYKQVLKDFELACINNDMDMFGKAINKSSSLNDSLLPKPHLEIITEISMSLGAYAVNVAHSGSIMGVIIDCLDEEQKYINEFIKNNFGKYFGRMYCLPIIKGGIINGRMI